MYDVCVMNMYIDVDSWILTMAVESAQTLVNARLVRECIYMHRYWFVNISDGSKFCTETHIYTKYVLLLDWFVHISLVLEYCI